MTEDTPTRHETQADLANHVKTYRSFVKGVIIFAGHVAIILLALGWYFSNSFV